MRAVVDTNVLLSGLFWRGAPHRLIEHIRDGDIALISSPALIGEFIGVLDRPKFRAILVRSRIERGNVLAELRRLAEIVDPSPLPEPVTRDPDDDMVLALAVFARADLVISGDGDLLSLGSHAGIPIIPPAIAIARIRG